MDFYLQCGHGMMAHARDLVEQWGKGGAILSPRDLDEAQLIRAATEVNDAGGAVLFDPQCYVHDADHKQLTAHPYWQSFRSVSTMTLLNGDGFASVLADLASLATKMGTWRHILPGLLATRVDDDWFALQDGVIAEAPNHFRKDSTFATIALGSDVMRDEKQIEAVVDRAETWDVHGVYVVAETPGSYLVEDPIWLANLLILVSGLRLQGKTVIVGYSNHQSLCLAAAGANVIASGTWLNVRAFAPEKFYVAAEDDNPRRKNWYYCPQALSEYKVPFLDVAQATGVLAQMAPDPALGSVYADPLFSGAQPTTVEWKQPAAFRHYLTCLRSQACSAWKGGYTSTYDALSRELDSAEAMLRMLRNNRVLGGDRDFSPYVDVNRAALAVFDRARGAMLRRRWP